MNDPRQAGACSSKFNEDVSRAKMEGRELAPGEKDENVVLAFRSNPPQ
jgi:hypothetical protein